MWRKTIFLKLSIIYDNGFYIVQVLRNKTHLTSIIIVEFSTHCIRPESKNKIYIHNPENSIIMSKYGNNFVRNSNNS